MGVFATVEVFFWNTGLNTLARTPEEGVDTLLERLLEGWREWSRMLELPWLAVEEKGQNV